MSLINEALKKAQRDRHLDNLPASAAGGARSSSQAASGPSKSTMILVGAGALVLFVVAVVGTVLVLNREPAKKIAPAPSVAVTPAPATPVAPAETTKAAPSPIAAAPTPPPPAPAPVASPRSAPAPVASTATTPPAIVISIPPSAPAKTEPAAPAATSSAAPIKLDVPSANPAAEKFDPRLQTMVDGWHINLVRVAGPESRLFMNGSSFRIGDVIDRASGLKLTEVTATTLTFTDSAGSTYSKRH